jgi:hypothetical protein
MGKKAKIDMGNPGYEVEDWNAYHWCINNNIYIAPYAKSYIKWYIDITNNGKTYRDPEAYGKTEIWIKIFEYCKYYYNKRNKDNDKKI